MAAIVYAVLSLTVIRMVPVLLCLAGTGMRFADKLFLAWFGPRGLATLVFGVIVFDEKLPGNDTIVTVAQGASDQRDRRSQWQDPARDLHDAR